MKKSYNMSNETLTIPDNILQYANSISGAIQHQSYETHPSQQYSSTSHSSNQYQPSQHTSNVYKQKSSVPKPPPTPGPRPRENIRSDVAERFIGCCMIQKDEHRPIEDYFVDYDHWEVYSESKVYSRREYQASYSGKIKTYVNYLFVLRSEFPHENADSAFQPEEEYYVVSKKVRTELDILEKYCKCFTCSASVLNPLRYIWCPVCTGCIKAGSGMAKKEHIEYARQAYHEASTPISDNKISRSTWIPIPHVLSNIYLLFLNSRWIKNYPPVKIAEMLVLCIFIIFVLYCLI